MHSSTATIEREKVRHLRYIVDISELVLARRLVDTMGVSKESLEVTLTEKLQPTYLKVIDTSGGCGASFDVEIASAAFAGKRLLERHRVVNTALSEEMKAIHALSITKALTPEQWQEQNAKPAAS